MELRYYNKHKADVKENPKEQEPDESVPEFNMMYDDNGMSYLECYTCNKHSVPMNDQSKCLNLRCSLNKYSDPNTGGLH